ncbi:MAG: hypothetical protein AVDCRST_MAG45-1524, partial [uncultured Solirubrobacterales bacterium]
VPATSGDNPGPGPGSVAAGRRSGPERGGSTGVRAPRSGHGQLSFLGVGAGAPDDVGRGADEREPDDGGARRLAGGGVAAIRGRRARRAIGAPAV